MVCSQSTTSNKIPKCFKKDNEIHPILNICREAKVQISGKNFEPDWGLFNGALGVVNEILFKEEEYPLDGYLPQYVIVDFPTYCGPVRLESHPSWVPIPAIEIQCPNYCCSIKCHMPNRPYISGTISRTRTSNTMHNH